MQPMVPTAPAPIDTPAARLMDETTGLAASAPDAVHPDAVHPDAVAQTDASPPHTPRQVLVRYGRIPEVARFVVSDAVPDCPRGSRVVVQTHRGPLVGDVLGPVLPSREPDAEPPAPSGDVLRHATEADEQNAIGTEAFETWQRQIDQWDIAVELLDVERSLDGERTTLYVLNGRDAAPTQLALQAAAKGLGLVDVQPVTAEGLVPPEPGGGCGSCGCG